MIKSNPKVPDFCDYQTRLNYIFDKAADKNSIYWRYIGIDNTDLFSDILDEDQETLCLFIWYSENEPQD